MLHDTAALELSIYYLMSMLQTLKLLSYLTRLLQKYPPKTAESFQNTQCVCFKSDLQKNCIWANVKAVLIPLKKFNFWITNLILILNKGDGMKMQLIMKFFSL